MIFAAILAGGAGSRMGHTEKPKPFLSLGKKPIILHTIEKFYIHEAFEKIFVLCPLQWKSHTEQLLKKAFSDEKRIIVLEGGSTRNETIMNAVRCIEDTCELNDETVIVTHDAVRPFVTYRIIEENIRIAKESGACDTVIQATDTVVESNDGILLNAIPERYKMFQGQTPQSFKAKKLKQLYESLNEAEKERLTDAAGIFVMKGEPVCLVKGELFNIKITWPYDLKVAEILTEEGK